jgi:hypothetical protein
LETKKRMLSVTEIIVWVVYSLFVCTMFYMRYGSYREYEPRPGFCFSMIASGMLVLGGGIFFRRLRR